MIKKRIIPCLDIKNGRVVKGINFLCLADAGNPVELAYNYAASGADELVFLDITATLENRKTLTELVTKVAAEINIPFTVGGGINSVKDAEKLIRCGADKICLNSAAVKNPKLINDISKTLGDQAVVVAIDTKYVDGKWQVFVNGGTRYTGLDTVEWAKQAEQLGAGEILLTSMNNDGTKSGFSIEILDRVCNSVNIPVIASGGAGTKEHFSEVFTQTDVSAALAAGIFHYGEITIPELKDYLKTRNISIR